MASAQSAAPTKWDGFFDNDAIVAAGLLALLVASDIFIETGRDRVAPLDDAPESGAVTAQITTAPEPASMALLATGLAGVVASRRRRKDS